MDKEEKERLWTELEAQGRDSTQKKLGLGLYGNRRAPYVEEWLRQTGQEGTNMPWHKTTWGKTILKAAVSIFVIVAAAYLVTRLGLN